MSDTLKVTDLVGIEPDEIMAIGAALSAGAAVMYGLYHSDEILTRGRQLALDAYKARQWEAQNVRNNFREYAEITTGIQESASDTAFEGTKMTSDITKDYLKLVLDKIDVLSLIGIEG